MSYDKIMPDGTRVEAPRFTRYVLDSVPVIFQLFEWLLVIVVFQYADVRFGYIAAKITWIGLSFAFAGYFGVLVSNVEWRFFQSSARGPWRKILSNIISPALVGVIVLGSQYLVRQMVVAQG